jgi:hypothetical protein
MSGFCERGNEYSGVTEVGEFFSERLSAYHAI